MGNDIKPRFLVDEDVPRSTARVLKSAGFDAIDVRDVGLRGSSDKDIFEYSQREERILVSCDLGFANTLTFPPAQNQGIIVVRIPDSISITRFNQELLQAISELGERLQHHLAIVEIGRVRLRNK